MLSKLLDVYRGKEQRVFKQRNWQVVVEYMTESIPSTSPLMFPCQRLFSILQPSSHRQSGIQPYHSRPVSIVYKHVVCTYGRSSRGVDANCVFQISSTPMHLNRRPYYKTGRWITPQYRVELLRTGTTTKWMYWRCLLQSWSQALHS